MEKQFRASTIVFTWFHEEEELLRILGLEKATWYLYGRETCPNTGKKHLQGMCYRNPPHSWGKIKARAHIEKCQSPTDSITYCSKEGDTVEYGLRPIFEPAKRKIESVKRAMELTEDELRELPPTMYYITKKAIKMAKESEERKPTPFQHDFRPWQKELLEYTKEIHSRKIMFICDNYGNAGKTKFAGWLGSQPGYQYLGLMKKDDLLHLAKTDVHTYLCDFARSESEMINYATLEKLADGYWTSGKYEGKTCQGGDRNVIVFMNALPNLEALSRDRYIIKWINHLDMSMYTHKD